MRQIKNKILLIKIISYNIWVDKMNLNSVVFLIQEEARKDGREIFNYEFRRVHLYPLSQELERDIIQLMNEGYVQENEKKYEVTTKGKEFLKNTQRRYFKQDVDAFIKYLLYINKEKNLFRLSDKLNAEYGIICVSEGEVITTVEHFETTDKEWEKEKIAEKERNARILKRTIEENEDLIMQRLKKFKTE